MKKCYKDKVTRSSSTLMSLIFLTLFGIIGSVTLAAQETIWPDSKTPGAVSGGHLELGTVFHAIVSGRVTHLRVYSVASESGDHTARLWRNADNTAIGGPYTWNYGGADGWITLDIPDVAIEANINYTVSISTGADAFGAFPFIAGDTVAAGGNGTNLFYPANASVVGGIGTRPTDGYNNNYLRDVVFMAEGVIIPNPQIEVQGNGIAIANGDATPGTTDGTDFGQVTAVGGTVDHIFTITNGGNSLLNLTGTPEVSISGPQASDFTVALSTSSVVPGSSGSFTIRFVPSAVGARSATVTITNNSAVTPYSFDISGSGSIAGPLEVETIWPDSKAPGLVAGDGTLYTLGTIFLSDVPGKVTHLRVYSVASESGAHTARLWRNADNTVIGGPYTWNYGGTDGWITLDIPDVAIEAYINYTVSISTGDGVKDYPLIYGDTAAGGGNGSNLFYPANSGVITTSVGIRPTSSYGNNYLRDVVFMAEGVIIPNPQIEVQGNGIAIANGDATPGTTDGTDFGQVTAVGGTVDHIFTITNGGNSLLNLTGTPEVSISGSQASDFTVALSTSSVVPGSSGSFTIRFAPSAVGARSATVTITNNSAVTPYSFDISGSGSIAGPLEVETIWPDIKTPGAVSFGLLEFGTIFLSDVPGKVTHLRVYSVASESGAHTARLWRNADNTVIGGPYTWNYGGTDGWITLDIPDVAIEANTNYTVSISTGDGTFPYIAGDTVAAGGNGTNLFYPANASVAGGLGIRPTQGYNNNYLRDIVFMPDFKIIAVEPDLVTGSLTIRWVGQGTLFQVLRSTSVDGPFAPIGNQQAERSFTDPGVLNTNGTFFYRVSR